MAKKAKKIAKKASPTKKGVTMKMMAPKPEPLKKTRMASRPKNAGTLSYTQSEFIENLKSFCGLTKRSLAKELVEDISLFVRDALKKGYRIPLMGLGKMYVRQTKPRQGRNPATGEIIQIPARKRVRFTPTKALKEAVLR